MSLRMLAAIGVFLVGNGVQAASTSQEELMLKMSESEHKLAIDPIQQPALLHLLMEAQTRVQELEADCYSAGLYAVALTAEDRLEPAGYQAGFVCEDSPAPGVSVFFNTSHEYLGTLSVD
jgi:hypothetical protein